MKMSNDPLARLRAANPVPPEEAPSAESPEAVAMFERIVATPPDGAPPAAVRPFRRSLQRRLWVLIPAAVLAGAAAYAALHRGEPAAGVVCWARATMQEPVDRASGDVSKGDPISACQAAWAPHGDLNPTGSIDVPALTACVKDDVVIEVFPDEFPPDTCGHLGLDPYGGDGNIGDDPAVKLRDALGAALAAGCYSPEETWDIAKPLFDESGLAKQGWRLYLYSPWSETAVCGSSGIDADTKTVFLTGREPPAAPTGS
jgi:hypothetical protein